MNTAEAYGVIGGVLILAALLVTAIACGWLIITWGFSVKVVPPWQRHAPPPKRKAAPQAGHTTASQGRGPNGQFLPKVVADGQKAS